MQGPVFGWLHQNYISIGIAITNIAIYRQAIVNSIPVDFYISYLCLSSMTPPTSEFSDLCAGVIILRWEDFETFGFTRDTRTRAPRGGGTRMHTRVVESAHA